MIFKRKKIPSGDLIRLTVKLTPRAAASLTLAAHANKDSRTDTVNRALQMYAYLSSQVKAGDEVLLRDKRGNVKKVSFQ